MKIEDIRYEDFKWNKGSLYLGKEYVGVSVRQDIDKPKLYWIMTDLGESDYPYNETRAKDNAINITLEDINKGGVHKGVRRYLDAFK